MSNSNEDMSLVSADPLSCCAASSPRAPRKAEIHQDEIGLFVYAGFNSLSSVYSHDHLVARASPIAGAAYDVLVVFNMRILGIGAGLSGRD